MRGVRATVAICAAALLALCAVPAAATAPPAGAVAPSALAPATAAVPTTDVLWLAVRLNGADQPDDLQALRVGDDLALSEAGWRALGLPEASLLLPGVTAPDGQRFIPIASVAGLRWRIDGPTQTLQLDAPAAAFAAHSQSASPRSDTVTHSERLGGYLNYDLFVQRIDSRGAGARLLGAGTVELGSFAPGGWGYGSTTTLLRDDGRERRQLRLDTQWSIDLPASASTLRFGDSISAPGAWGRAVRIGGVQWSTNFATRPGFVPFPLPSIGGEAVLPSVLDVFVNDGRRLQTNVPAGPFSLTEVPVPAGQGQIRLVTRDALGREQVVLQPYHVSPELLRPGLHAFSISLGAVRRSYGARSNDYGRALLSAVDRYGINDRLTIESRAELTRGLGVAGFTATGLLPWLGRASGSTVASRGPAGTGAMATVSLDHQASDWSASLQVRRTSRRFEQIGQPAGSAAPWDASASIGTTLGGVAINALVVQQARSPGVAGRIASLNLGTTLAGGQLTLSAFAEARRGGGRSVLLSYSRALDPVTSAMSGVSNDRDGARSRTQARIGVQRSAPVGEGFGYQVDADAGEQRRASAEAVWNTSVASLRGGVAHAGHATELRASASGSVAWLGTDVFLTRRVDGGFALVKVDDYPGVQVLLDNHPVARTDARGRALIGGLRGYEVNRIGIDAADLPFDAEVHGLERLITPAPRSGIEVRVPVQRTRAATFRLLRPDGQPVPAGSELLLEGSTRRFPVGLEGKGYAAGLGRDSVVRVRWAGQECRAVLPNAVLPRGADDELAALGDVTCE